MSLYGVFGYGVSLITGRLRVLKLGRNVRKVTLISLGKEMNVRKLYDEDVVALSLRIHEWLTICPLAHTEEGYDWLRQIVVDHLDPFSHGIRNYN